MSYRVAVGQVSSESNHFVDFECDLETFRTTGYVYEGVDVLDLAGTDTEVAGMLDGLADASAEVIPLLAARAVSSAPLTAECYSTLKRGLLAALEEVVVDGVLLSFHGSMLVKGSDDPEGEILEEVRARVGPRVAVIVTVDMHANITSKMIEHSDAVIGYRTYPHRDAAETGRRAAGLMDHVLSGGAHPVTAHIRLPMVLTAFHASTDGDGPFAQLMRLADEIETLPGVLSTSLFFLGSYIDVPEMGCSCAVITDGDAPQATTLVQGLARAFWQRRHDFIVETSTVAEAVAAAAHLPAPVLLLDTADTAGGGAAADSIDVVRELHAIGVTDECVAMVVDPEAAAMCMKAGIGTALTLQLGHKMDPRWGVPWDITGIVTRLVEGEFRYRGGIFGGETVSMGPSAVLQIDNINLLIMSRATYDWADEQYRAAGLDPLAARFIVVKNMMNFRVAYGDVMSAHFVLNLPGPTPPDMRGLPFRRMQQPIFPFDWRTQADFAPFVRTSRLATFD